MSNGHAWAEEPICNGLGGAEGPIYNGPAWADAMNRPYLTINALRISHYRA